MVYPISDSYDEFNVLKIIKAITNKIKIDDTFIHAVIENNHSSAILKLYTCDLFNIFKLDEYIKLAEHKNKSLQVLRVIQEMIRSKILYLIFR
jgi:hypothetical protein